MQRLLGGRLSLTGCATLRLTPSTVWPHSAVQIVFAFYCDIRHVSCQSAPLMEHRRLASRRLHASVRACFAPPCILHHAASRYILEALHRSIGFRVDATMTSYLLVPPLPIYLKACMKFPHSNCCFFCYSAVFGNYSATSPNCKQLSAR